MRTGVIIIVSGFIMTSLGLFLFYSIQSSIGLDPELRAIKHAGTFIGLMGIGVTIAGILLYLINRNQPTVSEVQDFDSD